MHGRVPVAKDKQPFESYIQPNTGHGMTLHYNSSGGYGVITNFISNNVQLPA